MYSGINHIQIKPVDKIPTNPFLQSHAEVNQQDTVRLDFPLTKQRLSSVLHTKINDYHAPTL